MNATRCSLNDARRAPGWSKGKITDGIEGRKNADGTEVPPRIPWRRYSQEQGKDVTSETFKPDFTIVTGKVDWDNSELPVFWLDGDSDIIEEVEILLPRADAEVPAPSADAPAASPAPPRTVSEAALRVAVQVIAENHPPGALPLDEETLHRQVETKLGVQVSRERFLAARDDVAPHFKRRVGRPRKNA